MAGVKKRDGKESSRSKLRSEAEKKVARSTDKSVLLKMPDLDKLVHELRVHQVELEAQNEELRGAQEKIAKSRDDYADLYDFSPVGYFTFNRDALIKRVNLTGAALLGVEHQKILKRRFRQFVAPGHAERWDRHFVSVLQQEKKQSCDLLLRRNDGSIVHARLDSIRVKMDDGTFVVRTGMSDITIQKQAEKALRESEEINRRLADYYRQLNDISIAFGKADNSTDLFSEIAGNFRLLTGANAASFSIYDQEASVLKVMSLSIDPMLRDNVVSMFGTDLFKLQIPVSTHDTEQMLTQSIRRFKDLHELSSGQLPRDISDSVMDAIDCQQIVALAISYAGEVMGTCIAYLREDQPVVPDNALKTYIQISAVAVKRKRAEEKWQAALAYNRSLIEASLDPLVTINAEGHVTDVNLATEKMTGFLRGEIVGTDFSDYFTEPEKARAGYQQVLTAGFVRDYPLDMRHRDGQITPVLYNAVIYRDGQGHALGIFAAARDVTERKRNEKLILLQTSVLKILASDMPTSQTADKVVEVIKLLTGYDAVGLRLKTDSDYPFVASLGYSEDFLKAENTLLNRYPDGGLCRNTDGTIDLECTCGMIISGKTDPGNPLFTAGGSAWTNNSLPFLDAPPDADLRLHPRNRCIHVGFLSLALIPIRAGAERMGLLHLADRKQDQFTPEAIRFYEGIGASIGVALAHKKAETALQMERKMLARTEGIAHIGSWEWEIATDTVTWSDELFRIFQRDPQEGAPSFAEHPVLYPPDDMVRLKQAVEVCVADGTPYVLELRAIRIDGETRVCIARGVAEIAADGQPARLFGSLQDITERKKGEEMLRESEKKHRAVVEMASDVIVIIQDGIIRFANPRVTTMFGYETGEIEGEEFVSFIPPENLGLALERYQKRMAGEKLPEIYETELLHKSGRKIPVETSGSVIEYAGKPADLAIIRDITERKQAEEKLLKSYQSLQKTLNNAINTMVKIVETRDPYTAGHQHKVADLAVAIAMEMEFDDIQIDQLKTAAVIHDIGKMYVPSDILSKPGKISDMEFSLIKIHAQAGYDIIKGMDFPGAVAETVLQHHERLDGSGYPHGLKADDTLMKAKILAVADVVEAMASHRPYRPALGIVKALEEISKNGGKLYDPDVVDACLTLFTKKGFKFKE